MTEKYKEKTYECNPVIDYSLLEKEDNFYLSEIEINGRLEEAVSFDDFRREMEGIQR